MNTSTQNITHSVEISTKISKLGASIPSINLPPIVTCRPDAPCAKCASKGGGCYALRGHWRYKHVQNRIWSNLYAYQENPTAFFDDIITKTRLFKFVRWFSSGDIVDMEFFKGMCRVARKNKDVKYLCFTKKYELINQYLDEGGKIPSNLRIVFSTWRDFIPENPYKLPMTWVYFPKTSKGGIGKDNEGVNDKIPKDAIPCSGKCETCQACWTLRKGQNVMFKKH